MSLALIEESAKEVRRLAIAGSPLAVGDFRLKKLVPPLEQAGAKVPVFAQVAKGISDLVNGTEAESAGRLLGLSTLLNAILYTQGRTSRDGELRELELVPTKCTITRATARTLKPLVEALTGTGSGRFEIVKSAVERGAFNELRLIEPAIQALGDGYPDLADLIAEKVLPAYGPGIVPRLKAGLDLKGKRLDARKLLVLHELDPAGGVELCKAAVEDGSADVKAVAIACLGKHEECLPLVLEQAKARNKTLCAAALAALAEHDRPETTKLFTELIQGQELDLLRGPFRVLRNPQVLRSLLHEGERVSGLLLKGDSEAIPRFWEILDCLEARQDPEVEQFLLAGLARSEKLAKLKPAKNSTYDGPALTERLARLLCLLGKPACLEAVLARRATLPLAAFPLVLGAALHAWTPAQVFAEFSPLLQAQKGDGKVRKEAIKGALFYPYQRDVSAFAGTATEDETACPPQVEWDPRWVDAAIAADEVTMVCSLAQPGHQPALDYLLSVLDRSQKVAAGPVIEALARCRYPHVTDCFLEAVRRRTKGATQINYELNSLLHSVRCLPVADLPRLEAFAATLDEKFADPFLEVLEPLRQAKATNQTPS